MLQENETTAILIIVLALFVVGVGLLTDNDLIAYGGFALLLISLLIVTTLEWLKP